jgi:hypothetical protein
MGTMIKKKKEVKEKEEMRSIGAKVLPSLFTECEQVRDDLRLGSMNELVIRALILYLARNNPARIPMSNQDLSQEGNT